MTRRWPAAVVPLAAARTVCDQIFHVRTGTLVYHWHPQVLGQTIVVPLTFAVAAAAMLRTAACLGPGRASWMLSAATAVAAYFVLGLVPPDLAPAYAITLTALWVVRVTRRGDPGLVALGVATAAGGVAGEAVLSAIGEFAYAHPDVVGVPWWLFGLYLHGSLAAVDATRRLGEISSQTVPEPRTGRLP